MGAFSSERFIKAHDALKGSMQQEIDMMREILANLHEEELSLLANNKENWAKVMQTRSDLVTELSQLRSHRLQAMHQLENVTREKLMCYERPVSFDELFPLEETSSSEIRSLLDQIMALVDRLNLQNSRNESLFYQAKSLEPMALHCPYPPKVQPRSARRKTSVATQQDIK